MEAQPEADQNAANTAAEEAEAEKAREEEDEDEDDGMEHAYEEIEWTPNHKLKRISEVDESELPASYRSNSKKEKLCLDYVANFERQFIDLYPYRAPLLLCPINECGLAVRAPSAPARRGAGHEAAAVAIAARPRAPRAVLTRTDPPACAARARLRSPRTSAPCARAEVHLHDGAPVAAAVQGSVRL
jgi:hypothetical protein